MTNYNFNYSLLQKEKKHNIHCIKSLFDAMKKALAFKLQVGPIYLGASSLAIVVSLWQIHQTASDKLSVFKLCEQVLVHTTHILKERYRS